MAVYAFPPETFPTDWIRALRRLAQEHRGTCEVERRFLVVRNVTVAVPDTERAAFDTGLAMLQDEIAAMHAIR